MKKIENKDKLIKAARIAKQVPGERDFWNEVRERMNVREKAMVKPRGR